MHSCKDCDARFDNIEAYNRHRRTHAKFSCPSCDKVFGLKIKLECHVRGCAQTRKNKIRPEVGLTISCLNYKHLPIVTVEELDLEFDIYMERKFGKKRIFRNKRMCKFCCKTFVMASDFADHIRDHYKSIPLDATSVKSKFDFMHFMGLKIRENEIDCSAADTVNKLRNKMGQCRVVIIGERCKICCTSFKCRTDLDQHNKIYHSLKNHNKVILVLRIGKEIISRISLETRYIRRNAKTSHRSSRQSKLRFDKMCDSSKCSSNVKGGDKGTDVLPPVRQFTVNNKTQDVRQDFKTIEERKNARWSIASKKKEKRRSFRLQNEINQTQGNMTRPSQEARGSNEIAEHEEVVTADEARNRFNLGKLSYEAKVGGFELESRRIYADEFFNRMQFSEPWKDEFIDGNESWNSGMKSKGNDLVSDEESYYCIAPRLIAKDRNAWEQEHYTDVLNDEERRSFHKYPQIYNYCCNLKYQADFSVSSDEKSYGLQVEDDNDEEANNNEKESNHNLNESSEFASKSAVTVKDRSINLTVNHSRTATYQCNTKFFDLQNVEIGKAVVNPIDKYQEVLIKEEVMLDDCTVY